jgi:oxygen-dependent protoporphyrinogen oxidase
MKKVTVVGAGFSGLTLSYYLTRMGFSVILHEKQDHVGGLLKTLRKDAGLVETAANSLLNSQRVEELFSDLQIPSAVRRSARRRRFIFWDKPRRWPLSIKDSCHLAKSSLRFARGRPDALPRKDESLCEWGERFGGPEFVSRLLSPALQGVYAGDIQKLSAPLILQSVFGRRPQRGRRRGSIAPLEGMGQLVTALEDYLQREGCEIHLNSNFRFPEYITTPTVVATPAWAAAEIFRGHKGTEALNECESLPLVSVTAFFIPRDTDLKGYGCLFPEKQGFNSLGVIFNDCIFSGRSKLRSETWIFGGAHFQGIVADSDAQLIESLLIDRRRFSGAVEAPLNYEITRWSRAIPHYTLAWEHALKKIDLQPPLYLHGNYLGDLGLSRILERSHELAKKIHTDYGELGA